VGGAARRARVGRGNPAVHRV